MNPGSDETQDKNKNSKIFSQTWGKTEKKGIGFNYLGWSVLSLH
jgi:hypothetical protein